MFLMNDTESILTNEQLCVSPLLQQRDKAQNISFETLFNSQFTLLTPFTKPNYLVVPPTDAAPQFL